MSDLELPIGAAFDPVPEPVLYLKDHLIVYCNPASRRQLPNWTEGSSVPEELAELGCPAAGTLSMDGRNWLALTWAWEAGVMLRLEPEKDDVLLPNRRLPLLSQKLRVPVASLMSAGEVLEDVFTPMQMEKAEIYLARLNKAELRLLRLVRSLELAALPDGKPPYDFHPQLVDLNGLCHEAQRQLSAPMAELGCVLDLQECPRNLYAVCDDDLVLTLIYHLVSNALRAMGHGGHIVLRVENRGSTAVIAVIDDGPGMSPEQFARAFAPAQGGDTIQEAMQGLGLGLTVCRKIARLHSGTLLLANRPERGVRAAFSLPRCQPGPVLECRTPLPRRVDSTNGVPLVLRELSDVLPERCFQSVDMR